MLGHQPAVGCLTVPRGAQPAYPDASAVAGYTVAGVVGVIAHLGIVHHVHRGPDDALAASPRATGSWTRW